jgi:16S rRNA processing protein RimM
MQEFFQIGIITGCHGVKGEVNILPTTRDPARFKQLTEVLVSDHEPTSIDFSVKDMKKHRILSTRIRDKDVLVLFADFFSKQDALALKGKFLIVGREDAIELSKDEYFIADIIGCEVYDKKRGFLGKITEVIQTGSNDVYLVKGQRYGEVLIPAINNVIQNVDIGEERIDVELLEGLLNE